MTVGANLGFLETAVCCDTAALVSTSCETDSSNSLAADESPSETPKSRLAGMSSTAEQMSLRIRHPCIVDVFRKLVRSPFILTI